MKFEYYVLKDDINAKEIKPYNIFNNFLVQEWIEKSIRKYLRAPNKYKYNDKVGFEALCEDIRKTIMWQMWSRCEYEIIVKGMFDNNEQTVDCYQQALPNIKMITRDLLWQYKQQKRDAKQ